MAPSYSFELLTVSDLDNEIPHRVYKRLSCFARLISTKLCVLLESTRIMIFLFFIFPMGFNVLGSIFPIIVASDIVGFSSQMLWLLPLFLR
jgi:hypothetical protein